MPVRNVGAMIIDLTRRESQSDQLSVYKPNGMVIVFDSSKGVEISVDDESVAPSPDLKVSGNVIFAAAFLLKMKGNRLVGDDLDEFDRLMASPEEVDEGAFYEDLAHMRSRDQIPDHEKIALIPRTPQPRKRKVSVHDLVNALEKALEVKKRRIIRSMPTLDVEVPKRTRDISLVVKQLYNKIIDFFLANEKKRLKFTELIPSDSKQDKIFTFIPLLHLDSQRKINLSQQKHFGDIEVRLLKDVKPAESVVEAQQEASQ